MYEFFTQYREIIAQALGFIAMGIAVAMLNLSFGTDISKYKLDKE